MTDTNQILQELYDIDPALREQEERIKIIISEMLKARPDTKFDAGFAAALRQRLMLRATALKPSKSIINFKPMNNNFRILAGALVAVILIFIGYTLPKRSREPKPGGLPITATDQKANVGVKKFASKEDFLEYLQAGQSLGQGLGGGLGGRMPLLESRSISLNAPLGLGDSSQSAKSVAPAAPARVSETNVQVKGIDEPDIVKTNGREIFVSVFNPLIYARAVMGAPQLSDSSSRPDILPPRPADRETKIIGALPPDKIKPIGKVQRQGEMLLVGDKLIIFEDNYVYGYDISKPESPEEKWKVRLENSALTSARLLDGKIYLVAQSYIDSGSPCPLRPLYIEGKNFEVPCTEIYHPLAPVADTAIYHAFSLNPQSGEIEKHVSFVGSAGQSVVYMSGDNLYITYVYSEDQVKILADFLKNNGAGLLPQSIIDRINKLLAYDISSSAKQVELSNILQKYYGALNQDDRRKLENDMENKLSDYVKAHMRDLTSTGLVKIALKDFGIKATGRMPGVPLNQFALDEFKGNLRVATTISGQGTLWGGWRSDSTANDVYVLDGDLNIIGSLKDLGLTERLYSARFVGERGFLVTFRQTDPFYVLDLSNPRSPKMAGQLKIPGFSSYLHPLTDNLIVGVGQENGRVKLSLFDVADSSNPKEIDKYTLDEYWSEAQNNHHAFLQDEKYQTFFLPGGNTGYVFSYEANQLALKKAVGQIQAKRALYIGDNLYLVGADRIIVLSEKTWERAGELAY